MTGDSDRFLTLRKMKLNIVLENTYEHYCMVTNKNIGESPFPYILMDQQSTMKCHHGPVFNGIKWRHAL
jgi:hypothetical protein